MSEKPRKLYKIIPLDEKRVNSIEEANLWFSKANSFNDPYDCAIEPYLDSDVEIEKLDEYVTGLENFSPLFLHPRTAKYYAGDRPERNIEIHNFVLEKIRRVGVCSLLSDPTNIVTWSHYGNQHKGVCLEYTWSDSMKAYAKGFQIHNVNYCNEMPFCRWKDFLSAPEFIINLMLSTKYKDWSYENEQRIVSHHAEGGQAIDITQIGLELTGVYLGTRFHVSPEIDEIYERLRTHCAKYDIPIKRLSRNLYSYRLSLAEDDPANM